VIDAAEIIPFQRAPLEAKTGCTVRKNSSLTDHAARSDGKDRRSPVVFTGLLSGTDLAAVRNKRTEGAAENAKKAGQQKACTASGYIAVTHGRSRQNEITQPAASAARADLR
jgi:hypothetical protein